ncbi:MAG: hypothetical protein IJZ94_05010 [Clostridia bacterium]|nr:hypothetical protein [Clostridia bacterium]
MEVAALPVLLGFDVAVGADVDAGALVLAYAPEVALAVPLGELVVTVPFAAFAVSEGCMSASVSPKVSDGTSNCSPVEFGIVLSPAESVAEAENVAEALAVLLCEGFEVLLPLFDGVQAVSKSTAVSNIVSSLFFI